MAVAFNQFVLQGADILNVTSLQFGPDGRLYAAQIDGRLKAFTVQEDANGYSVASSETIDLIRTIVNHNDDGAVNTGVTTRQVLGILVTGTAANPVIYVSSEDPRVGAGETFLDSGLDTNSGVISRLTKTATGWDKVDLVRGLPRSEENHATNGMQLDVATNTLYVAQGGNTNAGAPSDNFAYTPEYALSAAILKIDLNAINALPTRTDALGQAYKYDLPTVDDPTRANNPDGSEPNDPWGGNDGLNQARLVQGGPVQIYAPGFRNAYDIVIAQSGKMYTFDNGANPSWGGLPVGEGTAGITNQPSDTDGQTNNSPSLSLVTANHYGGHPNPIRANPTGAGLYNESGQPRALPTDWPPVPAAMADARQNDWLQPGTQNGALYASLGSWNGLTEYTSSLNFSGEARGDLLVAKLNDDSIQRIDLDATGTQVLGVTNLTPGGVLGNGFALDVTAVGDGRPFAGTVWVGSYGGGITVLKPSTNPAPPPADTDADDDGLDDLVDPFAVDADNGIETVLREGQTLSWVFSQNITPPGPANSLLNIGFTGVMTNKVQSYQAQYSPDRFVPGGAAAGVILQNVTEGSAYNLRNTQLDALQFGVNVASTVRSYVVETTVDNPFDAIANPQDFQNFGFFIGSGDQDNYLKLVAGANGGPGFEVLFENAGSSVSQKYAAAIFGANSGITSYDTITMRMLVDPAAGTVTPSWSWTAGRTQTLPGTTFSNTGATVQLTGDVLKAVQGTYSITPNVPGGDNSPIPSALAVGIIATSSGPADPFNSVWTSITVTAAAAPPDSDTDNDGLDNGVDRFALDPSNGFGTKLLPGQTLTLPLTPATPAASPFDGGFNGVMTTGTGSYFDRIDGSRVTLGPNGLRINGVTEGSAVSTRNTQLDALQRGFSLDPSVTTVVFNQTIDNPFDSITTPDNFQNIGFFVGNGDQDNYVKVVAGWNNGPKFEVMRENASANTSTLYSPQPGQQAFAGSGVPLTGLDTISMSLSVNVATGAATPTWSWTVGKTASLPGSTYSITGTAVTLTGATLQAIQGSYTVPVAGSSPVVSAAAFGVLATSAGNALPFDQVVKSMSIVASGGTPAPAPQPAKALLSITPSNTLTASTVDANGFTLTNQSLGGQQITRVVIDLSEAVLQDPVVFDPSNTASGKPFTINSQTGTFTVTPTFASGSANSGYTQLVLNFSGFGPGESLGFSLDADPLSLLMQATGVTASNVSGVEMSGSTVAVTYSDKNTQVAEVFGTGGAGAGVAFASGGVQAAPTLSLGGTTSGELTVDGTSQTLAVLGPAGATVRILRMTTQKQVVPPTGSFDGNTATDVAYTNVVIGANGSAQVSIAVPSAGDPLVVAAAVVDAQGNALSLVSEPLVLRFAGVTNQPPALTGAAATLPAGTEDSGYTVSVATLLTGYSDPDGDPLSVQSLTTSVGTVTVNSGSFTINPPANANGTVTLNYLVSDGKGGQVAASNSFLLAAVNDAPVLSGVPPELPNGQEDTPYTVSAATLLLGFTDVDGDTLSVSGLVASQGVVTINGNGTFTITPNLDFVGTMGLSYTVVDGKGGSAPATQSYAVGTSNDPPVLTGAPATLANGTEDTPYTVSVGALLTGFTDPDGDPLAVQGLSATNGVVVNNGNGTFTITPTANFNGPVTLNYTVVDGLAGTAASLGYTVTAVNDLPARTGAAGTLAGGTEDTPYTFAAATLLQGFTDVDGNTLALQSVSSAQGSIANNGNGTFTLTPNANFNGTVTIAYAVVDGQGGSVASSLSTNFAAVNDAPVFTSNARIGTAREHLINSGLNGFTSKTIGTVAASDADGNALTYSIVSDASGGAFTINANTGVVTVRDLSLVDSAGAGLTTDSSGIYYNLSVRVSDGTTTATQAARIYITDVNSSTVNGSANFIDGSNGANSYNLGGGADFAYGDGGNDTLVGAGGADYLSGGTGADSLTGSGNNDILYGGPGLDTLTGGTGADTFVFGSTPGPTDVDRITDFSVAADKIHLVNDYAGLYTAVPNGALSAAAFDIVGAGAAATSATRVIYQPSTGALFYDADGTGGGAAVQFATLPINLSLTAGNFVAGPHPGP